MKLQEDIFTSLFYVNQQLDLLVNLSKYTREPTARFISEFK